MNTTLQTSACLSLPVNSVTPSIRTLALRENAVHSVDLAEGERCSLSIRTGTAWVTMEGDPDDHLFGPSSHAAFTGPGRLVIEAITGTPALRLFHSQAAWNLPD